MIKPFWVFGIDRTVQNVVGTGDYGLYFAIFNFSFLFNILLDMGISNFNNRNIAQNKQLIRKHFSRIIVMKMMLGGVYLVLTFLTALLIGYDSLHFRFLAIVTFNQFLLSLLLYLRSNISGLLLFRTDSFLSVLDRLLMILLVGILLWGKVLTTAFRIEYFILAQTLAYIITVLIAFIIVARHSHFRLPKWDIPFYLLIIKKSAPFALLILLMGIYARIDSVLLERLLPGNTGTHEAGIYAQGFRILDAANQIAFLFAVLLLPAFSYMIKQKEPVRDLVRISFNILFVVSISFAIMTFFFSKEMIVLLYPKQAGEAVSTFQYRLDEAVRLFPVLMMAFVGYASTYVFGTLLTAKGDLKSLNKIAFTGMIISLLLNILLIPRFFALGSAYANFIAQWITALLQIYLAHRYFKFNLNIRYLFSLIIFIFLTLGIFYFAKQLETLWYWQLLGGLSAALIFAVGLRIVDVKEFYFILLKKE
jgi:O-antigen/teichoic acid export membrane protein